jgi:hypothetical protein
MTTPAVIETRRHGNPIRQVGPRVELARYTLPSGEQRILFGQRVDGVVRVTDVPAARGPRAYLVERGLEQEGHDALSALVVDYVDKPDTATPSPPGPARLRAARHAGTRRSPPMELGQVDALLASCDRSTVIGSRDLAILTVLARQPPSRDRRDRARGAARGGAHRSSDGPSARSAAWVGQAAELMYPSSEPDHAVCGDFLPREDISREFP